MFVDNNTVCSQPAVGEYFLNPYNCQEYYRCVRGEAVLQSKVCKTDHVFNTSYCKENSSCKVIKSELLSGHILPIIQCISITNLV